MKRAILWFRRDLRLTDNPALSRAVQEVEEIFPVFVFDPGVLGRPDISPRRVAYVCECLKSLDLNLRHLGSRLLIRQGDPVSALDGFRQEVQAEAIFFNRDVEPYAQRRDAAVEDWAHAHGITVVACDDVCVHPPGAVLKEDGSPYTVFTPFKRAWISLQAPRPLPRPQKIKTPAQPASGTIPTPKDLGFNCDVDLGPVGERAALDALKRFVTHQLASYHRQRDFPAVEGTSRLSAHLRHGTLSGRTVVAAVRSAMAHLDREGLAGAEVFLSEIIWRDFYKHILAHFPRVEKGCFRSEYDSIRWENRESWFQKWCDGCTGFPIVDAAMRQLKATGWMHNRLRMIVASFLTKDLLIDWRKGELYFMNQLIDGDLAANNGGWQWAAGTGTDAQPYFRIFNPSSQAAKFDPEGSFIARWVPEIGTRDYPPPIVDHAVQRGKALALYQAARVSSGGS